MTEEIGARGPATSGRGEVSDPRERLYETAVRLFARNGFAATGVRELAREAEVNLATVNYFYGSKKGLLKAILEDFFGRFIATLEGGLAGEDDPMARLRRTIAAVARLFAAERDKLLIVITELPHDDPDIIDAKADAVRRIIAVVQSRFLDDIEAETGVRPPLAVVGPAMTSLVASQFIFRPVIEKLNPEGIDATALERYPELVAELYINGLNGVIGTVAREAGDG